VKISPVQYMHLMEALDLLAARYEEYPSIRVWETPRSDLDLRRFAQEKANQIRLLAAYIDRLYSDTGEL
jgi:hypothetical protein